MPIIGVLPHTENEWNMWKNCFSEMKGDVENSYHEEEQEQADACTNKESN